MRAGRIAPVELLKVVADATCILRCMWHSLKRRWPTIHRRTQHRGGPHGQGAADRRCYCSTPVSADTAGSQTSIAVMQNATAQPVITVATRPEETIRRSG